MIVQNFLYDLTATQPNSDGDYHGGGKFAKKVFFAIDNAKINNWNVIAFYDSKLKIDEEILNRIESNSVKLIDIADSSLRKIIETHDITKLYTALPFNIIRYGLLELNNEKCSVIGTVHGLRTLEIAPGLKSLRYYRNGRLKAFVKIVLNEYIVKRDIKRYKYLFDKMDIITVSNHTKHSIMSFFPTMQNNIPVFYSPDVTEFDDTIDNKSEVLNISNYYLLVSGNRWLKNNLNSAVALDNLFTDNPNMKQSVIITGVSDPRVYLSVLKNKDRFIFYKYVSEAFLKKLYTNAYAFVYMSLNEGFGYPPLEAMKHGIPVITSPFTSIPEICGDAVLYANPNSIHEIKNRILMLQENEVYRELSRKGELRYEYVLDRQNSDLHKMLDYLFDKKHNS